VTALISAQLDGNVLNICLRRGEQRNALSRELLEHLGAAFRDWSVRPEVRVLVLRGEGMRAFAAGGDVKELMSVRTSTEARQFADASRGVLDAVRDFPLPVIAALNGDALGGGAELALACDWRIAAAHARIGFLQAKLAITTAWGGSIDLMRLIGTSRAMQLLCGAEILDARRALEAGLIDVILEADGSFESQVEQHALRIAERPRQVLEAFKRLSIAFRNGASRSSLGDLEADLLARTWTHEDHWQAANALFR
jgi:enoyl-CoA hydratase